MRRLFHTGAHSRVIGDSSGIVATMRAIELGIGAPEFSVSSQDAAVEDFNYFPIMHLLRVFLVDSSPSKWIVRFVQTRDDSYVLCKSSDSDDRIDCMICGAPESVSKQCLLDRVDDHELLEQVLIKYWSQECRDDSAKWMPFLAATSNL